MLSNKKELMEGTVTFEINDEDLSEIASEEEDQEEKPAPHKKEAIPDSLKRIF